ncbi:Hypothetical protein EfmE4453_2578, partial [Enterococcus faecium E4453]
EAEATPSYFLELNASVPASLFRINGVQKLASARLSHFL